MKKLDKYIANLNVGLVYLHNIHWNVVGRQFLAIHNYTEELYDDFFEMYDSVAEYKKMKGLYPPASLKEYLELTNIKELESKDYSVDEAISLTLDLIKDMKVLAEEIADETNDFILSDMMEDHITNYVKVIWFLESMAR